MARVRVSEAAKADIRAIYRFGAQRFGVPQADRYAASLRQAIKALADYPMALPVYSGLRQAVRIRPCGSHLIVYILGDDGVHVLRVRHGADDWTSSPEGEF